MKKLILSILIITGGAISAQNNPNYWQQHVDYKMDVDMNVDNFQYTGSQELKYTNNSPDTLKKVYLSFILQRFSTGKPNGYEIARYCRSRWKNGE